MSSIKNYTKAQQEYRDKLLRKKPKKTKQVVVPEPIVHPRSWYMKNCLLWIDSYERGECTIDRVYEVLLSLEKYTDQYIIEILKKSTELYHKQQNKPVSMSF